MRFAIRPFSLWVSATSARSVWGLQSQVHSQGLAALAFVPTSRGRPFVPFSPSRTSLRMSSASASGTEGSLRIALCQFHVTHNKEENQATAKDYVDRAAKEGAQMVVLPEIWNSPYATAAFPEYAETLPDIGGSTPEDVSGSPSSLLLMELARQHQVWLVGGSIPEVVVDPDSKDRKIYNTCLVFNPQGEVVVKHRKVHLFDIDVPGGIRFKESDTLSPGETVSYFSTPNANIGVGICYDIRFPEYAMLLRQKHDCAVLVYPGAFNLTTGPAHWELLQRGRALDNQCYVVTASPARSSPPAEGEESKYPHYSAWGHSTVVSPWGDVIATTDEKEGLVVADLDLSRVDEVRKSIPIGIQRRTDMYTLDKA